MNKIFPLSPQKNLSLKNHFAEHKSSVIMSV